MKSGGLLSSRPLPAESFRVQVSRGSRSGAGASTTDQTDTLQQGRDVVATPSSSSSGSSINQTPNSAYKLTPGQAQPLGLEVAATATTTTTTSRSRRGRGGFVYVPRSYDPRRPSPLAVMLHGAGGRADPGDPYLTFGGLQALEASACLLLVPESTGATWDLIRGGGGDFGPDVAHIDAALGRVFGSCAVDAGRVALAGFSDGASYALSLGLANPQLFTHLLAFSPGFMRPPPAAEAAMQRAGSSMHSGSGTGSSMHSGSGSSSGSSSVWPRVFVSHGTGDRVLPVGCSRGIVTRLRAARIDVSYHEFEGGHVIPGHVAAEGLSFFLSGAGSTGGGGGARE
ncbi:hypothetical protein HYH02_011654 [Chlamydomonas schloesseri]|uniref:Phospholipase/carboxylesterase/thioesterase domain-containing protein n=1 Tax=Chlamydomonas schloesseri TaxID=2026947 RepID=A0A835W1T3_9CHLO|nr:hypothetical protein HYH02_011654 [Chlamydomonas schloesseri]|eukprot:KAG2436150.1 hypothetical protein HYH02_011654 [Chlamydomonas schloesseri]